MTPKVNLAEHEHIFERPELLQHPQIPAPLAGIAPRVIMGREWWDVQRRKAYAENNYHCWACTESDMLDAHEVYKVDYKKGTSTFIEVTALCRSCHNFIHIGRYGRLMSKGKIGKREFMRVVKHGLDVLDAADLKPNWGLYQVLRGAYKHKAIVYKPKWLKPALLAIISRPPLEEVPWDNWRMVFEGKEYPPQYTLEEYHRRYRR